MAVQSLEGSKATRLHRQQQSTSSCQMASSSCSQPEGVGGVVEAVLADAAGAHGKLVAAAVVGCEGEGDGDDLALAVRGCQGQAKVGKASGQCKFLGG